MFIYHSEQVHSEFANKKGRTKVHSVSIKGKEGNKISHRLQSFW